MITLNDDAILGLLDTNLGSKFESIGRELGKGCGWRGGAQADQYKAHAIAVDRPVSGPKLHRPKVEPVSRMKLSPSVIGAGDAPPCEDGAGEP
jgi:hypothetical protein